MQTALATSALMMGLAGGPHCVAMCGTACAGVIRIVRLPAGGGAAALSLRPPVAAPLLLHAGRVIGYAAAGALVATVASGLAVAGEQVAWVRPLWLMLHAAVLAWGVLLAVSGRQPVWSHRLGRRIGDRLRPWIGTPAGIFAAGALWFTMPCGLLYSALMLASLASGPAHGALVMTLFAVGSGVSLLVAPWVCERLRGGIGARNQAWGARLGGLMLAAMAGQALWIDMRHQVEIWCR